MPPDTTNASSEVTPVKKTRRKRGQTRIAIIEAAIELLMQEGPSALTTINLAEKVGIVQSGFYAHFKTIEECLHALVHEIDLKVRQPLAKQMVQLRLTDAGDPELLEVFYKQLFDLVEENWKLMEVFLHFRGDHSIVGKMLNDFETSMVQDLTEHLRAIRDVTTQEPAFGDASTNHLNVLSHMMLNQGLVGMYHWKMGNISKQTLVRLLSQHISKIGPSAHAAGIGS